MALSPSRNRNASAESKSSPRNTRQKSAIREVFLAAGRPLGPQEVLDEAAKGIAGLGIATVYRNIRALVDEGWLTPVDLPGEASRYEVAGKEHHHHFHCRTCDKVFELPGCSLSVKPNLPKGFVATSHELVLYGTCALCGAGPNRKN
jgi:Fur family ferric uptake transcriptional regulator